MATSLEGKKINESYKDLLQIDNDNVGIDTSLTTVSDGGGTESPIRLSSSACHIGTPTDIWSSETAIEVGGVGYLYTHGSYRTSLVSNGYRNSSGKWTSLRAGSTHTGASIIDLDPGGDMYFGTTSSLNTGDEEAISTRMTVKASGLVGIGTTTPAQKLHVVGNVMVTTTDSDDTKKNARILARTYSNNDYNLITGYSSSSSNTVSIGGGTSVGEPATQDNICLLYTSPSPRD